MDKNDKEIIGANPLIAIGIAIGLAMLFVTTAFLVFINSGAYTTVKQIKAGTDFARSIKMDGYDTKSPIKTEAIEQYQKSIEQRLKLLSESGYFSSTEISDNGLGLTP